MDLCLGAYGVLSSIKLHIALIISPQLYILSYTTIWYDSLPPNLYMFSFYIFRYWMEIKICVTFKTMDG